MRPSARASLVLGLIIAMAGTSPLRAQDSVKVERPSSDLITREQIESVKASNLLDVVEALHSNWLRERTAIPRDRSNARADTSGRAQYTSEQSAGRSMPGEAGGIQVYFDGTRVGGLAELKNIRPADVHSVRRINGVDAQARYGIGHGSGVLFVSSMTMRAKSPN